MGVSPDAPGGSSAVRRSAFALATTYDLREMRGIEHRHVPDNKVSKNGTQEKNKDVIFLQNEPEKLFRINKTP
jgi:hypothetical protein